MRPETNDMLVRRLDPLGPQTVIFDEATGDCRVKPGSLYLRRNESGLSVYELKVLRANGLSKFDACRENYNAVAMLSIQTIEQDSTNSRWASDPWPNGEHPGFVADAAHALIFPPSGLSRNKQRLFFFDLAVAFGRIDAENMEAVISALRSQR